MAYTHHDSSGVSGVNSSSSAASSEQQLTACIAELRDGVAERFRDTLTDARARLAVTLRAALSSALSIAVSNADERTGAGAQPETASEVVAHRWALSEGIFEVCMLG